MEAWKAELFLKAENELGEGPEWNPANQLLSWVDILLKKFHYIHLPSHQHQAIDVENVIGFAIPTTQKNLYITGQLDELRMLDIESSKSKLMKIIPENKKLNRFNDAKCDKAGRLFAGTTTDDFKNAPGAFYRIENDFKVHKVLSNIGCSNGLCWSADSKRFYYIDTVSLKLRAYDYNLETGIFSNEAVLLEYPKENGFLDGMTIDGEGKLWIAIWGGSKVIRFCPIQKKIIGQIAVNAKQPTSVVFAGKNLEKLFITSARVGVDKAVIKSNPEEGALFVVETKIQGAQNYPFQYKGE